MLNFTSQAVGADAIIDAVVIDTPVFINASKPSNGTLAGSLVLNNIHLSNVSIAVMENGTTILAGGTKIIKSWGQGNVYAGSHPNGKFTQGKIHSAHKDRSLLDFNGFVFGKGHPMYADYSSDQFKSIKSMGAVGDGIADDTAAINAVLAKVSVIRWSHKVFLY